MRVEFPECVKALDDPARYKILYGGRGSGKSWSVARKLLIRACQTKIRVLCARETQKSIDESVYYLLKAQIDLMGLTEWFEVSATKITSRVGSEFVFAGIRQQGVANLKSFEDVDICWVEEAQVVTKRSWDVLIPTIRKPGSEIWITFNPELDSDETYTRFVLDPPPQSIVQRMNYSDNPWFSPEMELERQTMQRRDPLGYRTIWEGECRAAVEGAIYAQEIDVLQREGRFTRVAHDPLLRVHTVWDLGWNDQTVILMVQRVASELRVIGALIRRFSTYEDDIAELRKLPYQWGTDWMPHDARAKSKESGGRSAEEIVKRLGRDVKIVPVDYIENGIKLARTIFPRLWVDTGCKDWLNSLKRYHRHVSVDGSKTGQPVHDDSSHGADALRYLAQVAEKLTNHAYQASKIKYPNLGMPVR
jgi:phage terminase large subunit